MKVGYGRCDITPTAPFYLLGYKTPARNHPAEGIHDRIYINALLIQNNLGDSIFLATGDLLEIEDVVAADIRQKLSQRYAIDYDNIVIGVTHTHHSVRDFHKSWEYGQFNQDYYDFLMNSFLSVFEQCQKTLTESTMVYGEDLVLGYYGNRNHKGQQSDNTVSVVKFVHGEKEIAGLVNLAVHSTVLSGKNMQLTADLAGNLSTKLQKRWGYYPLMLIGCAGDSSNHNERLGRDFSELERITDGLSDRIAQIKTKKTIHIDNHPLQVLTLSQEIINDKERFDADLHRQLIGMKDGSIQAVGSQPLAHLIEKCENQLKKPQFYDLIAFSVLDMGDLRLVTFPGELASAGGSILRNATEKTVLIAGYSNGFHHYFLEAKDYGLSFETVGNPVPPGTFERIINKLIQANQLLDKS